MKILSHVALSTAKLLAASILISLSLPEAARLRRLVRKRRAAK